MLNSRDIRDFPSPGQYDCPGLAHGQLQPTKLLSRQSQPEEVKYVLGSRPAPGYMELSLEIQYWPGPGLAGQGGHSQHGADL